MTPRQVHRRLDGLGSRFSREQDSFEKLQVYVSDLEAHCDSFDIPYDENYSLARAQQDKASKALRQIAWEISGIASQFQELFYRIADIEESVAAINPPPPEPKKKYNPPDAWKT